MATDKAYLEDEANSKKDDGCTAVAAVLLDDRLVVANVGDSRAVLSRSGKGERIFQHLKDDQQSIVNYCPCQCGPPACCAIVLLQESSFL